MPSVRGSSGPRDETRISCVSCIGSQGSGDGDRQTLVLTGPLLFISQLFYLVSVCLCVSVIVAFQLTAFTFRENLAATTLLLVLFGYVMGRVAAELRLVSEGEPPGAALNLLPASWFSLFPTNYVAASRGTELSSLSRTPGACSWWRQGPVMGTAWPRLSQSPSFRLCCPSGAQTHHPLRSGTVLELVKLCGCCISPSPGLSSLEMFCLTSVTFFFFFAQHQNSKSRKVILQISPLCTLIRNLASSAQSVSAR